jgi:protein-tyrosine-phosphatase
VRQDALAVQTHVTTVPSCGYDLLTRPGEETHVLHDLEDLPLDARLAMKAARDRLHDEFGVVLGAETVDEVLRASWAHMDEIARIKHHVPLLSERYARGQLWGLARMAGHHEGVPAVLFLDSHDAGRAKMAKALLLAHAGDAVLAFSAGTRPDLEVPDVVQEAMREVGVSLADSFPKGYTEEMLRAADHVVVFGDAVAVALPDGVGQEAWDVPDPRQASLDQVRALRDDLAGRVAALADRLGLDSAVRSTDVEGMTTLSS